MGEKFCSYKEGVEGKASKKYGTKRSKYEITALHMTGACFNVKEYLPDKKLLALLKTKSDEWRKQLKYMHKQT